MDLISMLDRPIMVSLVSQYWLLHSPPHIAADSPGCAAGQAARKSSATQRQQSFCDTVGRLQGAVAAVQREG